MAQNLSCAGSQISYFDGSDNAATFPLCGIIETCEEPMFGAPAYSVNGSCDPNLGSCGASMEVGLEFPGNHQNDPSLTGFFYSYATVALFRIDGSFVGQCGVPGQVIRRDTGIVTVSSGVICSDQGASLYSLVATMCPDRGSCEKSVDLALDFGAGVGCPPPPPPPLPWSCPESDGNSCPLCLPGGSSPAGGGPGFGAAPGSSGPGDFGLNASLRYAAGGAGGPGQPGSAAWNVTLGRYWSHDYAQRIVVDPDPSHVWLITPFATFREFSDPDGAGVYQTVVPSDEYRQLTDTGSGWTLAELDGTVHSFDAAGRWTDSVDRNGNARVADYSGGPLTAVSLPDGRSEAFAYHPSGKLASFTEVGVLGADSRSWSYSWSGDDLVRVDRPDGVAVELFYDDPQHPGYVTRMERVGTDASRRVERVWVYDSEGNVIDSWRGDLSATGPDAVDRWQLAFDDPALPAVATVTDPLGNVSTYQIGRDEDSRKPRLESLSGACPACSAGPNSTRVYGDPSHPLRPTRIVDGRGVETDLAYDTHGRLISRIEAVNNPDADPDLPRETTWSYNTTFPALPESIEGPATLGQAASRMTALSYDPATGDLLDRTAVGMESTYPSGMFMLTTAMTYNAAGRVLTIDPPGHGMADVTSYSYAVPGTNGLVADSRTEPLVGTTSFAYDPFNRRLGVTDPNGVLTETRYDTMNRVTHLIQRSDDLAQPGDPVVAADLETRHLYDAFGDLFRTILPEGNVIEYGYDAAGRLVTVERKPDAATPGERTLYTLDAIGNRIREERQRWDSGAADWVTESASDSVYSSRCHLDEVVHADGSVTEYAYDCAGNLERVWDANHPSAGQTAPATQLYAYDALDRLVSVTQPWGGSGGGTAVTLYGYDVQDHLTSVTDAEGNETTYLYSDRDLLTAESSPASGATVHEYDDHGELVETTDARGVTVTRMLDALDRVTAVAYPDPSLDLSYTYDATGSCAAGAPVGRLSSIARGPLAVDYCYDRFGRVTQDGALSFGYDENGNRSTIGYPGGVTASYTHDFADREATLAVQEGAGAPQAVVTAAEYLPGGPLTGLGLGNGLTEERGFDQRYHPESIAVAGHLDWWYTPDAVGNVTAIADLLDPAASRTYSYQDYQYFLTASDAPGGDQAWSYDKIGNRVSATEEGEPEPSVYSYTLGTAGNTPRLASIVPVPGFDQIDYSYDAAGNQTAVTAVDAEDGSRSYLYSYDDEGRLATLSSTFGPAATTLTYDGRGFLAEAEKLILAAGETVTAEPTYASDGRLFHRRQLQNQGRGGTTTETADALFYFAGRPVAQLTAEDGAAGELLYLTTDHLGTPILATTTAGSERWQGGFRAFGAPFNLVQLSGVFLRFPGQWSDPAFSGYGFGGEMYYNVFRWYSTNNGRYTRVDPVGVTELDPHPYVYVMANPLRFSDPLGLRRWPFGAGRFCRDDSCQCEPPVQVLGEDSGAFTSIPGGGQCVDADAVYSKKCVVKIPDNFKCTLKCDPSAPAGQQGKLECRPKGLLGGVGLYLLGRKPECFDSPKDIPIGWPPNPFAAGGSKQ